MKMSWNLLRRKMAYPIVALLIVSNIHEASKLGMAIIALGVSLRLWASAYLRKREALITAGPYGFVRNPLYLGSLIIGVGFAVMARNMWLGSVLVALFVFVYYKQVLHEERQLAEIFGRSYNIYRSNVPRLFPRLIPYRMEEEGGRFNLKNIARNKEYNVILGIIAVMLLMDIYEDIIYPLLSGYDIKMVLAHFVRHVF